VTGMSGAGKSTVLAELARRGHAVVETDEGGWCVEEPVARAVPEAVTLILDLIQREGPSGPAPTQSRQGRD